MDSIPRENFDISRRRFVLCIWSRCLQSYQWGSFRLLYHRG